MKMYLVTYVDLSPRNISHILDSIQPGGIPLILLSIHQANGDVSKVLERVMTCSPAICALTLRVWGSAPKRAGFNTFETPNIAVLLTEVAERVDREHAIQLIKMSSSLLTLPNSVVAVLWRKTEGAFLELHVSKDGEGDVIKPNISIQNESLLIVGAKDASQSEEICASLMQRNANLLVLLSNLQMKVPMIFIDAALQQMAEKVEDKSVSSFGPQVGMVKYVAAQVFGEDVLKLNVKQAPTRDKKGGVVAVSEFRICYEYLQRLKTLFDLLKTSEGSASDIERLLLITGGICTALQHHKANLDSKACTERSHEIDDVVANTLLSISGLIEVFVKLDATTPEQLEKTLSGVPSVLKPLMMSIKLEKMVSDELKSISLADAPCIDASKIFEFQHVLEKNGVYSQLLQDTMFDVLMFPSASQSNTNAEETINSALIANGTKLLRNSLRGSSSEKTIDIVTRRLIALSPEGGRVDHQMKILQCFSEAPTVAKQHEIVVEELIGSGGTGLNAADFAKIVATMSRMKSLSNHRDGVKRVLERFFSTADPHSQTIILKGLSHDKEIILDNLDLLFDSIEGNIEVLGGDDLENVATALIQVSPFVAFEDVEDIIERVSTRVLSVADAAKKSSLVRVLQLLTHYKLQDTAVLEAIYESLEDKMPKLDINQLITVLKSMVVLEMQPRDKLILQVIRKLDSFIETMSPALIVSTLSLMVDLNIAFLPTTNSLFMKAHDHKDAIRQNKELTSLMEKASSEFIIEAPQHVTRHFLKRQKERLRMEALRQNILERRAKSLTVVV